MSELVKTQLADPIRRQGQNPAYDTKSSSIFPESVQTGGSSLTIQQASESDAGNRPHPATWQEQAKVLFAVARKGNGGCAKTERSSNETPLETDAVVQFTTALLFSGA